MLSSDCVSQLVAALCAIAQGSQSYRIGSGLCGELAPVLASEPEAVAKSLETAIRGDVFFGAGASVRLVDPALGKFGRQNGVLFVLEGEKRVDIYFVLSVGLMTRQQLR